MTQTLRRLPLLLTLAAYFAGPFASPAQESDPVPDPRAPKRPLVALGELMAGVKTEIAEKRKLLDEATTGSEKNVLAAQIERAEKKLHDFELDFQAIATGVDVAGFGLRQREKFDLGQEFQDLVRPLVEELKQATERPREMEGLRDDIEHHKKQLDTTKKALANIDKALAGETEPSVVAELKKTRARWEGFQRNSTNQLSVFNRQLEQSVGEDYSTIDTVTEGLKNFVRTRGKYLFATIFTFVAVFVLLRFLGRYLYRISPWHRKGKSSFYSRLIEVVLHVFTFVGALVAAMLVLYATGDWVLLGLAIIFLFGLILAAKDALPRVYEQARILLNLGEVREGERVVVNGVPWAVETLGIFTKLHNPKLLGGKMRLPIRVLSELRSRPYSKKEPWFPCEAGDWVILSDGTRGRVIAQTPELVELVMLGGSHITYQTADFLAATPKNISGSFRVRSTFGIDYKHQALCTTEIPKLLTHEISGQLVVLVGEENVQSLRVEFLAAGASSLDYEIIADIKGAVADRYEVIGRALQRAAVDACNEHGWTIPFTQITLHQADAGSLE